MIDVLFQAWFLWMILFFFFIDCPVSSVILIDHALRTVSGNSMGGMNLLSILSWTYIYLMGMENPRIFQ